MAAAAAEFRSKPEVRLCRHDLNWVGNPVVPSVIGLTLHVELRDSHAFGCHMGISWRDQNWIVGGEIYRLGLTDEDQSTLYDFETFPTTLEGLIYALREGLTDLMTREYLTDMSAIGLVSGASASGVRFALSASSWGDSLDTDSERALPILEAIGLASRKMVGAYLGLVRQRPLVVHIERGMTCGDEFSDYGVMEYVDVGLDTSERFSWIYTLGWRSVGWTIGAWVQRGSHDSPEEIIAKIPVRHAESTADAVSILRETVDSLLSFVPTPELTDLIG